MVNAEVLEGIGFKCEADWPSESLEQCPFEGDEYQPAYTGSRIARRRLSDLRIVTIATGDLEAGEDSMEFNIVLPGERLDNKYIMFTDRANLGNGTTNNETETTTQTGTAKPEWPNKWTTLPCCTLSCACFKYLKQTASSHFKYYSEDWMKQRCCYEQMILNPICANPPPLKKFRIQEPPLCLT